MKLVPLLTVLFVSATSASLFFEEPRSEKLRKNLESIGYNILDSTGLVKDSVVESLDPEGLQVWLEDHGITYDNVVEAAKEHKDLLLDDIKDYVNQGSDAGKAHAEHLLSKGKEYYDASAETIAKNKDILKENAYQSWSDSRLKEFLDARGVPVPQTSTRDHLLAKVAQLKHNYAPFNKANSPSGRYWFDGWSRDDLVHGLKSVGSSIEGSRRELVDRLYNAYSEAYEKGKADGEKAVDDVHSVLGNWKEAAFDSWSLEDLKDYLSEFGSSAQGTKEELVNQAKASWNYFTNGFEAPPPPKGKLAQLRDSVRGYFARITGLTSYLHYEL